MKSSSGFNLSNKIRQDDESYLDCEGVIDIEDVKEFINQVKLLLSEYFQSTLDGDVLVMNSHYLEFVQRFKKLAGDKLQ